ncbi:uncharacterized protein LOC120438827 [Oreochromis aureus]|uniref:uncharacterized protein LOC120438827 n=1 Tax=Oreochromis aureus TaxID=47969 RepID=UPI001952D695|nr:uncharacterized protein LOC120438827 [Oreochromis aureus]
MWCVWESSVLHLVHAAMYCAIFRVHKSKQMHRVGTMTTRNMLKSSSKENRRYKDRWRPEAKQQYLKKLECIANLDPYEIRQWSKDPDDLPPLSYPDIFTYLVCGVSAYTANQFRDYKSLEAHIQFTNGWVQVLAIFKPPNCEYVVIHTKVLHSQRLNEPALRPWVIVSTTGKVEAAHCTCMARVAETCTHVAALLFKVEAAVRIRGTKTVTDEPAYWVLPGNTIKIQPEVGHNIEFTSSAAQKKTLDENIKGPSVVKGRRSRPSKRKIPSATFEELSPVLDTLQKHNKAVCLSGLEKFCTSHTVQSSTLPLSLTCLHNTGAQSLGLTELRLHCVKYVNAAKVTEEQAEAIEVRTRLQHRSPQWYV